MDHGITKCHRLLCVGTVTRRPTVELERLLRTAPVNEGQSGLHALEKGSSGSSECLMAVYEEKKRLRAG